MIPWPGHVLQRSPQATREGPGGHGILGTASGQGIGPGLGNAGLGHGLEVFVELGISDIESLLLFVISYVYTYIYTIIIIMCNIYIYIYYIHMYIYIYYSVLYIYTHHSRFSSQRSHHDFGVPIYKVRHPAFTIAEMMHTSLGEFYGWLPFGAAETFYFYVVGAIYIYIHNII